MNFYVVTVDGAEAHRVQHSTPGSSRSSMKAFKKAVSIADPGSHVLQLVEDEFGNKREVQRHHVPVRAVAHDLDPIEVVRKLRDALASAEQHLDWIGWGDSYERSCIGDLPDRVEQALAAANQLLEQS